MRKNLRHKAYEKIKEMIIFLELKPGQKIFESDISAKLKIGRTPVREALLMLENEKLVVCGDTKGFTVRNLSPRDMNEYFKMRTLMENFAIPLLVERITPSEIRAIEKNIERATEAVENASFRDIIRYETQFHEILYRATRSEVFIDTMSYLVDKFQWLRAMGLSAAQGARESLDDHRQILHAIHEKDEKALKHLFEKHLQHAQEKVSLMRGLFFMGS
ncbi:MAG: GntR family transcriptional regulator [Deltaproteobacteria bacterium]|nr:GntR family transcriptional regulator [Deltaproteobacteria bacterium]